jgi:hypothetical protein
MVSKMSFGGCVTSVTSFPRETEGGAGDCELSRSDLRRATSFFRLSTTSSKAAFSLHLAVV